MPLFRQFVTCFATRIPQQLAVGMLATLCALPVSAETFYKWRDANGVWVYGSKPPAGVEVHVVKTSSGKVSSKNSTASADKDDEETSTKSDEPQELIVEKQISAKERKALCESATTNLDVLNSRDVIRKRDADGNVTLLTDDEKKTQIERAKIAKKKYC